MRVYAIVLVLTLAMVFLSAVSVSAISEADYTTFMTGQLTTINDIVQDYTNTLNDYVAGDADEAATLAQLQGEQDRMRSVRDGLRAAETPCPAYDDYHTLVTSAAANFFDGIRTTAIFVETDDPSYGDLAVQYLDAANDDIRVADAELRSLSRPACQITVSPAGGDGLLPGILVALVIAVVIGVISLAAARGRRKPTGEAVPPTTTVVSSIAPTGTSRFCPTCSKWFGSEVKFCPEDGTPLRDFTSEGSGAESSRRL